MGISSMVPGHVVKSQCDETPSGKRYANFRLDGESKSHIGDSHNQVSVSIHGDLYLGKLHWNLPALN